MMHKRFESRLVRALLVAVAAGGFSTVALAGNPAIAADKKDYDKAIASAQDFATKAAVIGKAEIELAQLAVKQTEDANVRSFAQRMITDHTATEAKLKTIAAKDKLTLPQSLDSEHAAVKQKLAGLKGEAFDQAYSKEMAKGHEKAVALFESASQNTALSPELKQFAASTLPTLKDHRAKAHDLHGKEGG
jgi:putative membrane protein